MCNDMNKSDFEDGEMEYLSAIKKFMDEQDSRSMIAIPDKVKTVIDTYKSVKQLFAQSDNASVKFELFKPSKSQGYIEIEGNGFVFQHCKTFTNAIDSSDMIEIIPRTDGTMYLSLTFNGLTAPID